MKKIYRERVDAESERENGLKSKMKGGYIKIELRRGDLGKKSRVEVFST